MMVFPDHTLQDRFIILDFLPDTEEGRSDSPAFQCVQNLRRTEGVRAVIEGDRNLIFIGFSLADRAKMIAAARQEGHSEGEPQISGRQAQGDRESLNDLRVSETGFSGRSETTLTAARSRKNRMVARRKVSMDQTPVKRISPWFTPLKWL